MKKLSLFIVITFICALLGGLQSQMSDPESFLNTYTKSDKNKDYDQDGSTENVESHVDIIKDFHPYICLTDSADAGSLVLPPSFIDQENDFHFYSSLRESYFIQHIFRPPIAA